MNHRPSLPARAARHLRYGQLGTVPVRGEDESRRARLERASRRFATVAFKSSVVASVLLGLAKVVLGLVAWSPFVIVNGLYSLGIGQAKFFCLDVGDQVSLAGQWRRYRYVGVTVIVASLAHMGYGVSLFAHPGHTRLSETVSIGVAAVVFFELGLAIQQSVTRRHDPSPLVHAAKLASLAAGLVALSLVQIVLLGAFDTTGDQSYGGWGSVFCDGLATLVGLGMGVRATVRLRGVHEPRS
ncbi:MAG: hypothetical protein LBI33_09320 [Propionibacteriaceae bacterium]|jgi:hypothetical protein|nr:hypothetical protein [Propionibacteriaceae bacterium]